MRHLQTIDLREGTDQHGEQQLLDRMHAISDARAGGAWSDDHELELLMLRYESLHVA